MVGSLVAAAIWLAAAAPAPPGARTVLVATAVEPLRVDKLADALRTYLDARRVEVRTAPAVASDDLRADLGALAQAGAGEDATSVLRITSTPDDAVEIALTDLPSRRTIITTIPRSERDEDLYRTLALKVQGLLRVSEEQPPPPPAPPPAPSPAVEASAVDVQGGFSVVSFPVGDVTQAGIVVRPRWAVTPALRVGLGLRVMPSLERQSGGTLVRMRAIPLVAGIEGCWRSSRFELAAGFVVLAETRYAEATAGPRTRSDWALVPGVGPSLGVALRLGRTVRLSLQAAAIGLPWSNRYRVDGVTVLDASRFQVPVDLALDVGI